MILVLSSKGQKKQQLSIFLFNSYFIMENTSKLKKGELYIINFTPSKQQQQKCFIDHYDEIEKDYEDFISLSQYDNELSEQMISKNIKENENNNDNVNNNDNDSDNDSENNNDEKDKSNDDFIINFYTNKKFTNLLISLCRILKLIQM